ncbi:hypothetical protein [Marinimicrobium locisalis]|uniref:hypothetical protein n=1 Tax=Marinimicrobium locisalis TaxID=546022 RepID=UPI0032214F52
MDTAIVKDAHSAYLQGRYDVAKTLYLKAGDRYGPSLFKANIELCTRQARRSEETRSIDSSSSTDRSVSGPRALKATPETLLTRLKGYYAAARASSPKVRPEFQRRLAEVQREAVESPLMLQVAQQVLQPYPGQPPFAEDRGHPQIAIIQSWDEQMRNWLKKQRQRGYRRFLLVNATADDRLLDQVRQEEGVTLFKPQFGDSQAFNDFWIACLAHRFKADIDETVNTAASATQ